MRIGIYPNSSEGLQRLCEKYENTPNCHPERSEGSRLQAVLEILRFAQNDKIRVFTQPLQTFKPRRGGL
jgi:hypothetical protein